MQILRADRCAIAIDQHDSRQRTTALIRHYDGRAVLGGELVTPLLKGDQRGSKRASFLGQAVEWPRRRATSQQDASRAQASEPIRQGIPRQTEAALKLAKLLRT